ncbi:MAG: 50S ribosomal protein L24 [Armatimonadetes bacterium]|nr:50S ribosomal protein L24 [Armatimonadota bacterium]
MRIKKGDEVMVIAGKDAGKRGKILHAFPKVNKVVVEGVNMIIRHQKARQSGRTGRSGVQQMQEGGRIEKPAPLFVPKVMLICPNCGKPTRVGYGFREGTEKLSARKYRVCKHPECLKPID